MMDMTSGQKIAKLEILFLTLTNFKWAFMQNTCVYN